MDSNTIDKILEICYTAVDKMAAEIDDHAEELNEHDVLTDAQKINKFFHTLGAATGNFLLNFSDVVDKHQLVKEFKRGLESFVLYCATDEIQEDGPPLSAMPGSLRVLNWFIDNQNHYN